MSGKGDKPRPLSIDKSEFNDNWDKIFNKPVEKSTDEIYIVGGGPSLTAFDWSNLDNKFVIGINKAYEKLPTLDILYFTDFDWWQLHKDRILALDTKLMRGRLGQSVNNKNVFEHTLVDEHGWSDEWGKLYHGINSTYAAIQVAAMLGAKTIYLLGIDMKYRKPRTHWHSGHRRIDPPNVFKRMSKNLCSLKPHLKERNIEVININYDTELKCFPIKTFSEVFDRVDGTETKT